MRRMSRDRLSVAVIAACAMCLLLMGGVALAESNWADEIGNALSFYKANYPTGNWAPYVQKLAQLKEGIRRDDHQIVKTETQGFLGMLGARAHGINDVAADELYNFVLSVTPGQDKSTTTVFSNDLGAGSERPMRVPNTETIQYDDGGQPCMKGGCDYWENNMFDPGPG